MIPASCAAGERARDLRGRSRAPRSRLAARRLEPLAQRLALDELGGDEVEPVDLADLVDGDDVRVVERGGGARFLREAAHPAFVPGEFVRQQLERDPAPEPRVAGQVDFAHPAPGQQRDHLVAPRPPARRQGSPVLSQPPGDDLGRRSLDEILSPRPERQQRLRLAA